MFLNRLLSINTSVLNEEWNTKCGKLKNNIDSFGTESNEMTSAERNNHVY
jgi:hypothetical protein